MPSMTRWLAILGFVAGFALVGYALFHEESDEEKIVAVLSRLEEAVRIEEPNSNLLLRKAHLDREFQEIFEADVRVSIPELSEAAASRADLSALAVRASGHYQSLDLDFTVISVEAGNAGATVEATAHLRASRGGSLEQDERPVVFQFTKVDGAWRIGSVSVAPKPDS